MNEDELLAQQVLADDPKAARKAAKSMKKINRSRAGRGGDSGSAAVRSRNRKLERAAQVQGAQPQMMHVPAQLPDGGQDSDIYNMVKGDGGKKTYYSPISRVILKIVCFVLIPLIAIFAATELAKNRYYPTYGNFNIEIYHAQSDTDRGAYYIRSRDTKRFKLSTVKVTTKDEATGKETVETYEGYYLSDLVSVSGFENKEGHYDYFRLVDADGNPRSDYETPHLNNYMIFVFKIVKVKGADVRMDVNGRAVPTNYQPTAYMLTDPEYRSESTRYFGDKNSPLIIKFGIMADDKN
jgi:hypothetical protein